MQAKFNGRSNLGLIGTNPACRYKRIIISYSFLNFQKNLESFLFSQGKYTRVRKFDSRVETWVTWIVFKRTMKTFSLFFFLSIDTLNWAQNILRDRSSDRRIVFPNNITQKIC